MLVVAGEVLLASSGWRPGTPNILERTGQPPTSRNYPTENVKVLRLGNPAVRPSLVSNEQRQFNLPRQGPSRT